MFSRSKNGKGQVKLGYRYLPLNIFGFLTDSSTKMRFTLPSPRNRVTPRALLRVCPTLDVKTSYQATGSVAFFQGIAYIPAMNDGVLR